MVLRRGVLLLATLAVVGLGALWFSSSNDVQAQGTVFELYADDIVIDAAGTTGTYTVGVRAQNSTVAAVDGSIEYDAAALTALSCTSLVDLGACNPDADGQLLFAAVDPDGFVDNADIPLFEVEFQADGAEGQFDIEAILTESYDVGLVSITGNALTGQVQVGVPVGDVNCNARLDLLDAREMAQYAINVVTSFVCPDGTVLDTIAVGDTDGDGNVGLLDARNVALCAINVPSPACPI